MNLIEPDALFRALSDATRLRCLLLLQREGELCVCEFVHALGLSQPKISRHLAQLRESGIVKDRREGLWIHYRLHPSLPDWVTTVIAQTADGAADMAPYGSDHEALTHMQNHPSGRRCT